MKPKFLIAILFLCGAMTVNAQDNSKVEKNAKAETEKIVEKFQLDTNQEMLVYRQNMVLESDLVKYNALDKKTDEAKIAIKRSGERYLSNMKNILTADQYAEFSKMAKKDKRLKK